MSCLENVSEDEDTKCPICSEERESETTTFVCKHLYCQKCIVQWYRSCVDEGKEPTCPLCRKVDDKWGT